MMEGSGSGSVQLMVDPDQEGSKTYGTGSTTLSSILIIAGFRFVVFPVPNTFEFTISSFKANQYCLLFVRIIVTGKLLICY
jgi:hypothetical protein